jgi:hypothetical protein
MVKTKDMEIIMDLSIEVIIHFTRSWTKILYATNAITLVTKHEIADI